MNQFLRITLQRNCQRDEIIKFLQWILATRQSEKFEIQRNFVGFVGNTRVSILLFFELQGKMKPLRISRQ